MNMVSLNINLGNRFFQGGTIKALLPEISFISELQKMDTRYTNSGCEYVFMICLMYGGLFEMGFDCEQDAVDTRRDIIMTMMGYWGPDNIICSNGIAYDITVCQAVLDMTEVSTKNNRAFFSLIVDGVFHPINLVYPDVESANRDHQELEAKLEFYRMYESTDISDGVAA